MDRIFLGALAGGILTLLTTIVVQALNERKQRRRALELVKLELIEISIAAWQTPGAFRFPLRSVAWETGKQLLVGKVSGDDISTLSAFYMQNELVEKELDLLPSSRDVQLEAMELVCLMHRLLERWWEPWIRRARSSLRMTLNPPTPEDEENYHRVYRATNL